jgi:Ni/Co efflux regulator RcnB
MLRRLVTLALLVPLVLAPAAMAAPGPTQGKAALTQADGKKKKRTAKHKKHRKHHRKTSRKKTGGARN